MRSPLHIFAATVALLMVSCIDGHEEYWLEADGRGRAEVTYRIPATVAALHGGEAGIRETIDEFIESTPEITTGTCEVSTEGNRLHITVRSNFDSALAMKDVVTGDSVGILPSPATRLLGEISASLSGRTLDFSRRVSPATALPGAAFLPGSQLDGHRLTYIMHLPVVPEESNATRTENGGRTLVWDIPLADAMKVPVVTSFRMRIPVPWRLVSAIAIPASLLAGGVLLLRRRKSRRRFPVGNPPRVVL
jgi:hypothetical protein